MKDEAEYLNSSTHDGRLVGVVLYAQRNGLGGVVLVEEDGDKVAPGALPLADGTAGALVDAAVNLDDGPQVVDLADAELAEPRLAAGRQLGGLRGAVDDALADHPLFLMLARGGGGGGGDGVAAGIAEVGQAVDVDKGRLGQVGGGCGRHGEACLGVSL